MKENEQPQQDNRSYAEYVTQMMGEPDQQPCDTAAGNTFVAWCCEDVFRDTDRWPDESTFWTYVHAAYVHAYNGPQF